MMLLTLIDSKEGKASEMNWMNLIVIILNLKKKKIQLEIPKQKTIKIENDYEGIMAEDYFEDL